MRAVAAIMAGGRGERLWPHSRTRLPKQFLSLASGPSFLQQTYDRLAGMRAAPPVVVLTSVDTVELVRGQLPYLPPEWLLAEPLSRDTAATAVLAATMAQAVNGGDCVLTLVPADHAVFDAEGFRAALEAAWSVAEDQACPVLLGIPPTRPETGYGYILRGTPLPEMGGVPLATVERFVEKPDLSRAAEYLASGRYLWNSGICVCRTDVLLGALRLHLPEAVGLIDAIAARNPAEVPPSELADALRALPAISLDYAILERVERAVVVEAAVAWDDVGGWEALARLYPQDDSGNVRLGSAVLSETARTVVYSSASGRLVVTHGVSDLVVVDTADSVLVAERSALPGLKEALRAVRSLGYAAHLDVPRGPAVRPAPWGHAIEVPGQDVRLLCLAAGADVPGEAFEGCAARLLSGQAQVRYAAGGMNTWAPDLAQTVPGTGRVVSEAGCVLALGRLPRSVPSAAAAEATPGYAASGTPTQECVFVEKPWGREIWWAVTPTYAAKRLEVRAGHALSLQYHERKHETLYFLEGVVRMRLGTEEFTVGEGDVAAVPPGTIHRMEAITDAVIFEVSTPELDDVVRLEDRYGRLGAHTPR